MYDIGDDLFLLVRPASCYRFVSLRRPLSLSPKDAVNPDYVRQGGVAYNKHKWHNSIRDAVEHAMKQGHEVYRFETFGRVSLLLRAEKWAWSDPCGEDGCT